MSDTELVTIKCRIPLFLYDSFKQMAQERSLTVRDLTRVALEYFIEWYDTGHRLVDWKPLTQPTPAKASNGLVSPETHQRYKQLSERYNVRMSDICYTGIKYFCDNEGLALEKIFDATSYMATIDIDEDFKDRLEDYASVYPTWAVFYLEASRWWLEKRAKDSTRRWHYEANTLPAKSLRPFSMAVGNPEGQLVAFWAEKDNCKKKIVFYHVLHDFMNELERRRIQGEDGGGGE